MARNPFEFLDSGGKDRTLLLLLLALIKKSGGEVELSLADLTAIGDGDSFLKYPSDTGVSLVLRFARRGAEAYFLAQEEAPSPPRIQRKVTPENTQPRHVVHDDLDLALREEEMANRAAAAAKERIQRARAEAGGLPWRNVPNRPQ